MFVNSNDFRDFIQACKIHEINKRNAAWKLNEINDKIDYLKEQQNLCRKEKDNDKSSLENANLHLKDTAESLQNRIKTKDQQEISDLIQEYRKFSANMKPYDLYKEILEKEEKSKQSLQNKINVNIDIAKFAEDIHSIFRNPQSNTVQNIDQLSEPVLFPNPKRQ